MIEAGVIIDLDGNPLHWHQPTGSTVGSLPDSQRLWEVFWEHKGYIAGFAHSHPGGGIPSPSPEDVTTFSAVERALGKRLQWWITSSDRVALYTWAGGDKYNYEGGKIPDPSWTAALRLNSGYYTLPTKENGNDNSIDDNNQ